MSPPTGPRDEAGQQVNDRRPRFAARGDPDRFGLILALLLGSFVLSGLNESALARFVSTALSVAALFTGFASPRLRPSRARRLLVGGMAIAGLVLVTAAERSSVPAGVGYLLLATVLVTLLLSVIQRVLSRHTVDLGAILGGVVAYFLLGMAFGWVYEALRAFYEEPVFDPHVGMVELQYYSFVVLTTLGFGDITPANGLAQRVTAVEALMGQIFLATLVARLVSMFGTTQRPDTG